MRPIDADRLKGQTMIIGFTTGDNFRKLIDAQPTIEDKTVVEYCAICETEVEMKWDVDRDGYKAFCPYCGNRLMLCDECQHRTGGACTEDCDYDSATDTCRFNKKAAPAPDDNMEIVTAKVLGTGYPIDGRSLQFTRWKCDPEHLHLLTWKKEDDEAVMLTIWQSENAAGLCLYDTLEEFKEAWSKSEWEPQGAFVLGLDNIAQIESAEGKEE